MIHTPFPAIINAATFEATMIDIWDVDTWRAYDDWHNARDVAEAVNANRLYSWKHDGVPGYAYQFVDGSQAWIKIDGSAVSIIGTRHKRRMHGVGSLPRCRD